MRQARLDTTGDWTAGWSAIKPGLSGALLVYPEGPAVGEREISSTVIITARSLTVPYDDVATFSMGFEVSGDVSEGTVSA